MGMFGFLGDAIGSILGAVANTHAQNNANQAAQGAANNQNQMVGTETNALNQLLQSYFGGSGGGGATNPNAIGGMRSTGMQGSGAGTMQNSQNMQNTLMKQYQNNPLNAGQQATLGTAGQLQNFNGLQPGQLSALQNTLGQNNESMVNSLRASGGGVANQNNMYSDLANRGAESATNLGVQLGGQAAGYNLAGLQSAGGLQSGVGSQQNQSQGQALSALLSQFGIGQQQVQTIIQALGGLTSMYGQQGAAAAQQSQALGSPWGNALTGMASSGQSMPPLGGLGSLFGGGQAAGAMSNTLPGIGMGMGPGVVGPAAAATDPAMLAAMGNQRHMGGGAPSAQGFNGGLGGAQNPNTGGFNGLGGSEMTQPGMGYQQTQGGLGSLGPAQR